jgi:hypothetical protein
VNGLLQARLIEGAKDEDGHLAIALNPHHLDAVRREIRPLWGHPAFWAILLLGLAIAGVGLSV